MSSETVTEVPFKRSYRKIMAILILISPFCTMVPYVAPAVFMKDIMESYQVGLSLAGLSMTIQLGATGICMFIGSFIQDRVGIRKSIIYCIWAMAVGNIISCFAPNIGVFLTARFISGFGQGLYTVSINPCISTWYDGKERTYMITFNTAINSVFLAISYAINRPLANLLGNWQRVLGLYAVIIVVVAVVWMLFSKESPEAIAATQQRAKVAEATGKRQGSLVRAAKEIQFWKIMLFAGTFAIANTAIASFLPTYLTTERGLGGTVATTISSLNSLFGIVGSLLGGFLCAQTGRRKPIMVGSIILYLLVGFGLTIFTSGGLLVVLALAAGALYFVPIAAQSNMMIETKQPFDPTILGGAACITSGIGQLLCVLVSFIFSAVAGASSMTMAYRVFFALCIIGLVGIVLTKETGPTVQKAEQPQEKA
ncbi:MAG: CynX/NimT family MFS transporter [Blautia sp.]|jgi:cyanate permease